VPCRSTCVRPVCGARPRWWQESRRRSLPSADAARAGTKQPATPGRQACSALGQPVGAAWCSRAVRPAARHPCSGLAAPAQRSHRADNTRTDTRSIAAFDDHPRPASTRRARVRTLHRVSEPHRVQFAVYACPLGPDPRAARGLPAVLARAGPAGRPRLSTVAYADRKSGNKGDTADHA
jgi:hypothetical protein